MSTSSLARNQAFDSSGQTSISSSAAKPEPDHGDRAMAAALLLGTALAASYLPARKAARTDPVDALRGE